MKGSADVKARERTVRRRSGRANEAARVDARVAIWRAAQKGVVNLPVSAVVAKVVDASH